MPLTE
jgi:hypothetical protein